MKLFRRDRRGAVSIMVSLMLIPALLFSGSAVDLARIHTAKSMAQNANQLATNSVLTQYHALLKDLYGLFGVMKDDPEIAGMINEYIQVAVFGEKEGEDWIDTGLGSFQNFNGSKFSTELEAVEGYDLGERDKLRRQIEEYMKFRGPMVLVTQLLEALSVEGPGIKTNYEAIEQEKKVLDGMGELFKLYGELYDAILKADMCHDVGADPNVAGAIGNVGNSLESIKAAFAKMKSLYDDWLKTCEDIEALEERIENESEKEEPNFDKIERWENDIDVAIGKKANLANMYKAQFKHIEALTNGGRWTDIALGYKANVIDSSSGKVVYLDDGKAKNEWKSGGNISSGNLVGLVNIIESAKNTARAFKANFANVVTTGRNIDNKRGEIRTEIAKLQKIIDEPDCDDTLRTELKNQIDKCNELLDRFPNIESLAKKYQVSGNSYIDDTIIPMLDGVEYRDGSNTSKRISISELGNISSQASSDDFKLDDEKSSASGKAAYYAGFNDVTYHMPDTFIKFGDIDNDPNGNNGLYNELDDMAKAADEYKPVQIPGLDENSKTKNPAERQRNILDQLIDLANKTKDGLISNPKGAHSIKDDTVSGGGWGGIDIGNKVIDLISDPGSAMQGMADWILIMTYDVSMFSNYTTQKPNELSSGGAIKKTDPAVSASNTTMSPKVNYFYQSEWEYLLIGNNDAIENLDAVKDLIFIIRIICNTIASFTIKDVKFVADTVQRLASAIPFVGPALGVILKFATHVAFATAESAYDLVMLRDGHKIKLLKMNDNDHWMCNLSGVVTLLKSLAEGSVESAEDHKKEAGLSYEHYMMIFFLVSSVMNGDAIGTLTDRTGNLVEWNVINYEKKVNEGAGIDADGFVAKDAALSAMSAALAAPDCFRLEKMQTDFNIKTEIDLRLLFLSLPLFQRQGSPFSNEFPITITDYRGF